jgi:hypothetical protein
MKGNSSVRRVPHTLLSHWQPFAVLALALATGLAVGVKLASAEYEYGTAQQPPYVTYYVQGYTGTFYQDQNGTFTANSYSDSYYCDSAPGGGCAYFVPYFLSVDGRGYNNDTVGWHMVDEETYYCGTYNSIDCTATATISTQAWQPITGHYPAYYVTAYHDLDVTSSGPQADTYTSDDGQHSTYYCYATAGC